MPSRRGSPSQRVLRRARPIAAALLVACGSGPAPRAIARPSLLDEPAPVAAAFPSPAEWRYHPREASPQLARFPLDGGGTLTAGQHGERWLIDPTGRGATAAAEAAPEDLVAITHEGGSPWLFLGQSGTSYESESPLGAFVRSRTPLEALTRVQASGAALVGLRRDGALLRSEDRGGAWSRVGPDGVRFQDVALRPDGLGLALAVPEAFYETRDFGATFHLVAVATLGARSLATDAAAGIVVVTPLGVRRWDPGAPDPLPPLGRAREPRARPLGVSIPVGPSAAALGDVRAVVTDRRWVEARGDNGTWQLVTGQLGRPLAPTPLPKAKGCVDVRLAGFASTLYLACARQKAPNVTQGLELYRSTDLGLSWTVEPYVVDGQTADLTLAVGPGDRLLVSGVCPAGSRGPGCRPSGVQVRHVTHADSGPSVALLPAAVPSLAGAASGLVFSRDGRTAYAFGRSSKSDAYAVFVSHDGGQSFDAREVDALTTNTVDETSRPHGRGPVESAAAAEDGAVAFVVAGKRGRAWLVVDEDGHATAVSRAPVEAARLGAVGQRGVAFDPSSREGWESLDGGASWASLGKLPADPCPGASACTAPIACVAEACVIGDVVSRIGFRELARAPIFAPPSSEDRAHRALPRVGTTLACALDPGEWRRLNGVWAPPFADQSAIGKLAWFARRQDRATAQVSVVQARVGTQVVVDDVSLLAPAKHPDDVAVTSAVQVEGVAALRYVTPGATGTRDATIRNVEVAWDDALSGRVAHATIPDAGPYRPGDYGDGKGIAKLAAVALVSIASGGVYVRLHAPLADNQPTFFVDGRGGVEVVPPIAWPEDARRRGHADMAHVGRAHVPLWIDGTTLVRARRGERGEWAFDAASVGFTSPKEFGLEEQIDVAYVGDHAGLHVVTFDQIGKEASSILRPFRPEGSVFDPPVRAPAQLDLPATPRPCTAADRASTPRVVVPFQPGTRHAVLVSDAVEPMRILLTGDAVLHGTPEAPCAAAFEAFLVSSELTGSAQGEQAILPLSTLEHSFLFHMSDGSRGAAAAVEYKTMSCRFDPGAEAPIEVFKEKGTLVETR